MLLLEVAFILLSLLESCLLAYCYTLSFKAYLLINEFVTPWARQFIELLFFEEELLFPTTCKLQFSAPITGSFLPLAF